MGGIFSKPKAPPPPPDTSEEDARRAAALEAEERRERKGISSRKKARGASVRLLMTQARQAPGVGNNNQFAQNATLGGNDGGVRNPRQTG